MARVLAVADAGTSVLYTVARHQAADTLPPDETGIEIEGTRDLFLTARDGGAPRRLVQDVPLFPALYDLWDGRGRLLVRHRPGGTGAMSWELSRIDPSSAAEPLSFGRVREVFQGTDRNFVAYQRLEGELLVRGADDVERIAAPNATQVGFVGDTLIFSQDRVLARLGPSDASPRVIAGDATWTPVFLEGRPHLVINTQGPNGLRDLTLVDAGPTVVTPPRLLARGRFVDRPVVSPDGARVVIVESLAPQPAVRAHLYVLSDPQPRTIELAIPPLPPRRRGSFEPQPGVAADVEFRPASDEVWLFLNRTPFVLNPDGTATRGPADRYAGERVIRLARAFSAGPSRFRTARRDSYFTADGRRWLWADGEDQLFFGPAGDPAATPDVPVIPLGTSRDLDAIFEATPGGTLAIMRELEGGRDDLWLLDPGAAAPRPLLRNVASFILGDTRAVAVVRKIAGRTQGAGDLVDVELATGAETILAHNVSEVALTAPSAGCATCDLTAPGTELLYVVQARIPWRFDGLWAGALP